MAKFNMLDLIGDSSKNDESKNKKAAKFKTTQISVNDLVPSEDNFYSTDEEELKNLKDSIEIFGIQQNLVVKEIANDKYEIIAGHRRYLALKELVEEGKQHFEYAPCKVEIEEDSIKDKLLLLITNSTARELTDWEKTQQAQKIKELLIEYKKKEKLPGRIRDMIADILNTSATQVARMESINNNLTKEVKEQFKEGNLGITTAYEVSKLPKEQQMEIAEKVANGEEVKQREIKIIVEEIKKDKVPQNTNSIEEDKKLAVIENDIVDMTTGEIVQQRVPSFLYPSVIEVIKDMNADKLATFICDRCNGGNGCAGFCDRAFECTFTNRHEICVKWLNSKT